jgi:hypothetical protein
MFARESTHDAVAVRSGLASGDFDGASRLHVGAEAPRRSARVDGVSARRVTVGAALEA